MSYNTLHITDRKIKRGDIVTVKPEWLAPENEGNIGGISLRFLTVDVQRESFYVVVRSWALDGSSRMMDCAHVQTWEDIVSMQEKYGVRANLVFVDAGYSTYEVYAHCAEHGWTALMGDKRNTFTLRPISVRLPTALWS